MKNLKTILHLTNNLLRYEWKDVRVALGFLAGMAAPSFWLKNFLDYAADSGEPVNILEAFLVVEHEYKTVMFLVLGWFLVVSDAPFINENTYYSLYRTKKQSWNLAMVLYILVQAALYTAAVALPMVLASLPYGYVGRMWSNPVYLLSQDFDMSRSAASKISFPWQGLMQGMDVSQAFAATLLCFFFYAASMGLILYTFNLLLGGIWGIVIAFLVHISGFGLPFTGHTAFALIEYARPGNFAGPGGVRLMQPLTVMAVLAAVLVLAQAGFIHKVDFRER